MSYVSWGEKVAETAGVASQAYRRVCGGMYVCEDVASLCPEVDADARRLRTSTIDGTGADGPRSEGGRKVLRDNSRVYVRFIPFVGGRFHLGRLGGDELCLMIR